MQWLNAMNLVVDFLFISSALQNTVIIVFNSVKHRRRTSDSFGCSAKKTLLNCSWIFFTQIPFCSLQWSTLSSSDVPEAYSPDLVFTYCLLKWKSAVSPEVQHINTGQNTWKKSENTIDNDITVNQKLLLWDYVELLFEEPHFSHLICSDIVINRNVKTFKQIDHDCTLISQIHNLVTLEQFDWGITWLWLWVPVIAVSQMHIEEKYP